MTTVKFQTSFDRNDWVEVPLDEQQRQNLSPADKPELVRALFPFKARVIKSSGVYNFPQGHTFDYARPKLKPASYPLEVLTFERGVTRKLSYNSDELELLNAD